MMDIIGNHQIYHISICHKTAYIKNSEKLLTRKQQGYESIEQTPFGRILPE